MKKKLRLSLSKIPSIIIAIDTNKTSLNSATVSCACPSSRAGQAFRLSAHYSHDANGGQSFVNFDAEL